MLWVKNDIQERSGRQDCALIASLYSATRKR